MDRTPQPATPLHEVLAEVAHEPHQYYNKGQMYHNLNTEAAAKLTSMVEMLISRRELLERLEHVWIRPDFISWRPGIIENDQFLCGSLEPGTDDGALSPCLSCSDPTFVFR